VDNIFRATLDASVKTPAATTTTYFNEKSKPELNPHPGEQPSIQLNLADQATPHPSPHRDPAFASDDPDDPFDPRTTTTMLLPAHALFPNTPRSPEPESFEYGELAAEDPPIYGSEPIKPPETNHKVERKVAKKGLYFTSKRDRMKAAAANDLRRANDCVLIRYHRTNITLPDGVQKSRTKRRLSDTQDEGELEDKGNMKKQRTE
jgi:hypothetical protein